MQVITRTLVLALLPVVLSGCSLHQRQTPQLDIDLPQGFVEEQTVAAELRETGRWWKSFNDPGLDALMEQAFAGNLDLARGFARLEQAHAVVRSTRAGQRPFVNLQGEVGRESTPSFFGENIGNSYRLSLAAGFELDLWQKLHSRTEAAALESAASRENLQTLYLGLSAQLADLYFLAAEQRAQLELSDQTIASFAETQERVERRYREGLVPAVDLYQARQNLAAAKAARPNFEAALAAAEHGLGVLLGRYPDRSAGGSLAILPTAPEAFAAGLPSQLLQRRPDLRAALLRVGAADARVAAAIAERFPSFNLLGGYGTSRTAFSTGDIVGEFWSLALSLAQPLVDGGRRRAEVQRSQAVLEENLLDYRSAALNAFREVEDALVRNRTGEERIARLEETKKASEAALRLALDRYFFGITEYLPVLTAQISYAETQSRLLSARRQLISDRISLARALGGDWMPQELDKHLVQRKDNNS